MTAPIPLAGAETFRVPAFEVRHVTEGGSALVVQDERGVNHEVLYDIQAVTYTDNLEEIDSFSLRVTNWDPLKLRPKYIGYAKRPTGREAEWGELFDLGKRFDIHLGYRGNLRRVISGSVSNITAAFPQSSAPTLTVDGLDVFLRRARREQHSGRWYDKTDSQIAKELSGPRLDKRRPGFECPVRTCDQAASRETKHPRVVMRKQSTISFLMDRARLHCYSVFVGTDNDKRFIYFGPSECLSTVTYTFEWGKTLLDFRPVLRVAGKAYAATVKWRDRQAGRNRETTAIAGDPGLTLNEDLFEYLGEMGELRTISDNVVRTAQQAEQLARTTVLSSLKSLVEATGTTIGLSDLRAGCVIQVKGIDYRLDGRWFVTQTVHTIDDSGYRTTFHARREQPGEKAR
jgi:phage protein D